MTTIDWNTPRDILEREAEKGNRDSELLHSSSSVNIYLELELFLDPPETDFDRLKYSLMRIYSGVWNSWLGDKLPIMHDFMKRCSPPGHDEGGTLVEQAISARRKREAEGMKKAALFIIDGCIEKENIEALVKEYGRYFQEETIKSWFALAVGESGYVDGLD